MVYYSRSQAEFHLNYSVAALAATAESAISLLLAYSPTSGQSPAATPASAPTPFSSSHNLSASASAPQRWLPPPSPYRYPPAEHGASALIITVEEAYAWCSPT